MILWWSSRMATRVKEVVILDDHQSIIDGERGSHLVLPSILHSVAKNAPNCNTFLQISTNVYIKHICAYWTGLQKFLHFMSKSLSYLLVGEFRGSGAFQFLGRRRYTKWGRQGWWRKPETHPNAKRPDRNLLSGFLYLHGQFFPFTEQIQNLPL